MTITKVQAWIGIITGVLFITITIGGDAIILLRTFEAYDARLAKLENAVKAINVNTPDEKYRELIRELMAEERRNQADQQFVHRFGKSVYPADGGASADAPSAKPPQ